MRMRLLIITATALLAVATFAVAPALAAEEKGAMEGVKEKAKETTEKATEKAKETTHEAKTQISDSWITSKAKIALFGDDRVKGTQVKVDTMKGVVTLRGKVDSDEAKSAAAPARSRSSAESTLSMSRRRTNLRPTLPTPRR